MAQKLARQLGLGVGISSGANLLGALQVQERLRPDAVVVTVFADDNKKYLSTDLMRNEPAQGRLPESGHRAEGLPDLQAHLRRLLRLRGVRPVPARGCAAARWTQLLAGKSGPTSPGCWYQANREAVDNRVRPDDLSRRTHAFFRFPGLRMETRPGLHRTRRHRLGCGPGRRSRAVAPCASCAWSAMAGPTRTAMRWASPTRITAPASSGPWPSARTCRIPPWGCASSSRPTRPSSRPPARCWSGTASTWRWIPTRPGSTSTAPWCGRPAWGGRSWSGSTRGCSGWRRTAGSSAARPRPRRQPAVQPLRADLAKLSFAEMADLARTMTPEDREALRQGAAMNIAIARHGLSLLPARFVEPAAQDSLTRLSRLVCAGVYARMNGEAYTVMSLAGSGQQGHHGVRAGLPLGPGRGLRRGAGGRGPGPGLPGDLRHHAPPRHPLGHLRLLQRGGPGHRLGPGAAGGRHSRSRSAWP